MFFSGLHMSQKVTDTFEKMHSATAGKKNCSYQKNIFEESVNFWAEQGRSKLYVCLKIVYTTKYSKFFKNKFKFCYF